MEKIIMENANSHPFKVSIVKDATMFANSHPYKVSIEGGGGNEGRVVDELPEEGEPGYIYLVLKESSPEGDIYDEYMWVLQQDGETYGWEHIGATNEVNLDVVKILTQDDYNWNSRTASATEPYDTIALWLLDDGLYKAPGITVRPVANTVVGGNNTNLYLVSKAESNIQRGSVVCFAGVTSVLYSAVDVNGQNYATNKFFRSVSQTTGSSTEDLMSQKAITDAINNASGVKTLTTADYNYPTNNPTRVGAWMLEPGIYKAASGVNVNITSSDLYQNGTLFIVGDKGSSSYSVMILSFSEGATFIKSTQVQLSDGRYVSGGKVLSTSDIVQSTGTSTISVMSQNAVTDAINNASGIKVLTTADYNYKYGGGEPDGVALWLLDEGQYIIESGTDYYTSMQAKSYPQQNTGVVVLVKPVGTGSNERGSFIIQEYTRTLLVSRIDSTGNNGNENELPRMLANNLTTNISGYALDARQGKVLNDKIGQIETVLQTLTTGNGV